jgi:DNA-binding MarR family transcriptional regulator
VTSIGLRTGRHRGSAAGWADWPWQYSNRTNLLATLQAIHELQNTRASKLAERLLVDMSVVSRRLTMMRRRGWIERVKDPTDRRAQLVTLSDSGLALWEELRESTGRGIAAGMPG